MASQGTALFRSAREELERQNQRLRRLQESRKTEGRIAVAAASTLVGAGVAGLVDSKWGEGDAAEVAGLPINGVVGGATAIAAAAFDIPYRREIGAAAIGVTSAAVYRYVVDNVSFDEDEETTE